MQRVRDVGRDESATMKLPIVASGVLEGVQRAWLGAGEWAFPIEVIDTAEC